MSVDDGVHELPLAQRLIEQGIRDWLDAKAGVALAAAGSGELNDYERGVRDGIDRLRHLYLDGYWYALVPPLIGELQRAGLLGL